MKKSKSLFLQLHEANEKIKNLRLMHGSLNEDYNELVSNLKNASQELLISEKLNKYQIIISKL